MLVKNQMSGSPVTVASSASIAEALRTVRQHRVRHLPVVDDGELVGIVSDRDLRLAMPSPLGAETPEFVALVEGTPVDAIMARDPITVGPTDTLEDAAVRMRRSRVGALPVVDAAGRLIGILTETDILNAFVEVFTASGGASRLEIAMPDRPGELARAVRVIGEECRLNISSIMMTDHDQPGRKRAVIHINTIDPREVIAALERIGCEVGWPSLEGDLRRGIDA
jgi:acetoin utilization protein AcuB